MPGAAIRGVSRCRLIGVSFLKGGLLATTGAIASPYIISTAARAAGTINVGVLFSLTGGLSIIEKSLHDATLMAISEINAAGGANGMKINAIVEDGASDPKTYNEKASKLVIQDRVPTVFGSYTSASRKAVLPGVREAQQPVLLSDLLRRVRVLEERRLYRRRSQPAALELHSLDHQDARQEEVLHRRFELHLSARNGQGLQDPDREKRRRVDRGRISRTRPFRMGLDGQQDQGVRAATSCCRTSSATPSSRSTASTRTRA